MPKSLCVAITGRMDTQQEISVRRKVFILALQSWVSDPDPGYVPETSRNLWQTTGSWQPDTVDANGCGFRSEFCQDGRHQRSMGSYHMAGAGIRPAASRLAERLLRCRASGNVGSAGLPNYAWGTLRSSSCLASDGMQVKRKPVLQQKFREHRGWAGRGRRCVYRGIRKSLF